MKKYYFFFLAMCITFQNSSSFAQDKQSDFKDGNNQRLFGIYPNGDEEFIMAYGKLVFLKKAKTFLMKFDQDLKPVWPKPLQIQGHYLDGTKLFFFELNPIFTAESLFPKLNIFSYTNPIDSSTTSYLFSKDKLMQILPDGNVKEGIIEIPFKELLDTAAIFADSNGLNVITITGKKFKSGTMNWYIYSHETLLPEKRIIVLPLPPGIDEDNESGWRLIETTSKELFFYYVSCRSKKKDKDRPISALHIIRVDHNGKAGKITTINMNIEDFHIIPGVYRMDAFTNFKNFKPNLLIFVTTPSGLSSRPSHSTYIFYSDNAFIGVKIDAKSNRIYTVKTLNVDLNKDSSSNLGVDFAFGSSTIKTFQILAYDLEGTQIYESNLSYDAPSVPFFKGGYYHNEIELFLLPGNAGLVLKIMQFGDLTMFAVDSLGKKIMETKTKKYSFSVLGPFFGSIYYDKFCSKFYSLNDIKNSPYVMKEECPVNQCFDKLSEREKISARYLSLKNYNLLAYPFSKEKTIRLNYYKKN